MGDLERIKELVVKLNEASKAYYHEAREIINNYEYDRLYDELEALEKKTGVVLSDSPTQKVGYEVLSELPKERHATPMLSLDKTKDLEALKVWLGTQEGILSWKLDGLTIVLTYQDGKLQKAVTRGSGEVGEVITNNARVFKNIPLIITEKDEVVVRGEAVIKYSDFEKINAHLELEEQYKNPRNLCSGSVRQLNNEITAKRNVHFFGFQLVTRDADRFHNSKAEQLGLLKELGFDVVDFQMVTGESLDQAVADFERRIPENDFGSDGLVLTYDDMNYSESLGATSKFPRDSIAFKWQDETRVTKLLEIEWSASRTGLINPVAIFEPVELEGTTVARASVHNVSILEDLALGIGDEIEVYKANMIIPQIATNLTKSGNLEIPTHCPVCGEGTQMRQVNDVKALYCVNKECPAKKVKLYSHFASRDAMNIEGLSEATLEKFVAGGFIHGLVDLFRLERYREEIVTMEGFGKKSFDNLMKAIEKAKKVHIANFIYALGILNVGLSNAKLLAKHFGYDIKRIMAATEDDLLGIAGFGEVIAGTVTGFFADSINREMVEELLNYVTFEVEEQKENGTLLSGKTFVITGEVELYENRNALKAVIESLGGKVTGSVTKKTDYLINNDLLSSSTKNKTAKELGIPIIDEKGFNEMIGK